MQKDVLIKLIKLFDIVVEEATNGDDEALTDLFMADIELEVAICGMFKRFLDIASKNIDADRLGELVIESGIDPEFYDKYLAN